MCGIAGAIVLKSSLDPPPVPLGQVVEGMSRQLIHRGPDASGLWISPSKLAVLSHRRLAIIDLTDSGRQPMVYAERFWVTFNGEIYNYKDLRSQLRALGHGFRGESDTEVLLAAVTEWGVDGALKRCTGMFAFAIWDEKDRILHLARDRMGEKPLYFGANARHLYFASELRAFHAIPGMDLRINSDAVNGYLRDGCVPGRLSMYRGIYKLPPGHLLVARAGRDDGLASDFRNDGKAPSSREITPRQYWGCANAAAHGRQSPITSVLDAVEQGEALLRDSVRQQSYADVPTGAFLSGGIDSSLVTALMQSQSTHPVRTFTVAFDDPRFDESQHARAIAEHLGTQHQEFNLTEREIVDEVPSIVHRMDEPTANGSFFPVFLISRLARTQVTVVLSGDGGDELFAGYNRYVLATRLWHRTHWIPSRLRKRLARHLDSPAPDGSSRWVGYLARLGSQVSSADTRRKIARMMNTTEFKEAYSQLTSWWIAPSLLTLNPDMPSRHWPVEFGADLPSMLLADQINYLPDDNLSKVDRASMATSLETRLPLLDHRLVEFSWRLPDQMKLRRKTTKWVLRAILDRYLPRQLIDRPKMGFTVPVDRWLRGPLRDWAGDMLSRPAFHDLCPIGPAPIRALWDEYLSGHGPSANEIWSLVVLSAWNDATRQFAAATAAGVA